MILRLFRMLAWWLSPPEEEVLGEEESAELRFQKVDATFGPEFGDPLDHEQWVALCEHFVRNNAVSSNNGPWPPGFFLRVSDRHMHILYYRSGNIPASGIPLNGFLAKIASDQAAVSRGYLMSIAVTPAYTSRTENRIRQTFSVYLPGHGAMWNQEYIYHRDDSGQWSMSKSRLLGDVHRL